MYPSRERNSKITILLHQKEQIFHTQDLAVLWGTLNKNTLYTTIKRYVQKKVLHRIIKGLYSTVPINKLDPVTLGLKMLHVFAYVSCETILQKYGLINALIHETTFVSTQPKKISIGRYAFRSRKLQDKFLYNPCGIIIENGIQKATKERAVADMLYFNPKFNFDGPVDWRAVKEVQKTLSYPLTPARYAVTEAG